MPSTHSRLENPQPEDIYQNQLVWIDWGGLRSMLGIDSLDPTKYSLTAAETTVDLIILILREEYNLNSPKLILGYQQLEADNKDRKKFLHKLWRKKGFPILKIPEEFGHQYIYALYVVFETLSIFGNYHISAPLSRERNLKFRQAQLDKNGFDLGEPSAEMALHDLLGTRELGEDLAKIIDVFRNEYKGKEMEQVYDKEKVSFLNLFKNVFVNSKHIFTGIDDLETYSEEKLHKYVEQFTQSEYFDSQVMASIWSNVFSAWLVKVKSGPLRTSDRGDLMGLLEIGLLADVGFVDKATLNTWENRFDQDFKLDIYKSGKLMAEIAARG
ncbi:hypothetical protein KC909_04490 [Candidatus Dojkabacteria bacterium]|uniref:Uncharacterized protein n=1 Tax=Candidatus Dojkabacteria bacterium TaxID=2099670 RepID=A0A955L5X3_9BACT|nr:hypothetical protein [Candidatus Dojkabacteria bacterium]